NEHYTACTPSTNLRSPPPHALRQMRSPAVDWPADNAVARQDGAIRAQPLFGGVGAAFIPAVLAGHRCKAFTRSIEVDAACLDAHAQIEHTVDDRAMSLIAGLAEAARDLRSRVAVVASQVGCECESDRPVRHPTVRPDGH